MGCTTVTTTVSAILSSHNDERDERDEMLWDELLGKIRELAADPRYASITPLASGQ